MRLRDPLLLHPTLRERVRELVSALGHERIPLEAYESVRTPWRQAALYARGRTDGSTKKVTNAKSWQSFHNYGLAVDFVFLVDKGRWSWDEPELGMWRRYHEIAKGLGLEVLSFEKPHIQLAGWELKDLKRGLYPPASGPSHAWKAWLGDQIEKWGPFDRDEYGAFHPGAPPAFELDDRPEIEDVA